MHVTHGDQGDTASCAKVGLLECSREILGLSTLKGRVVDWAAGVPHAADTWCWTFVTDPVLHEAANCFELGRAAPTSDFYARPRVGRSNL